MRGLKPVLYQHFGKLDLPLALLDQSRDTIIANTRTGRWSRPRQQAAGRRHDGRLLQYVAGDTGAFRLVFESDLTNEPAVREQVDRVTTECAAMIAHVIHDDTGLPDDASRLLAVSLVGMAQVSARFWLSDPGDPQKSDAASLVAGLAWRGIRGYPAPTSTTSTTRPTDQHRPTSTG